MPPKRVDTRKAQPRSKESESREALNSPFRYAEDATEERSVAEESASSPTVSDIPLVPNPESLQYLLKTVERMQSKLLTMEKLFQEQSLALASAGDTVPTIEAVPPVPPVAEVPFTLAARVDASVDTGRDAMLMLGKPEELKTEIPRKRCPAVFQ